MNKHRIKAPDVVLVALELLFVLGLLTVFQPCGPREDGSWMSCHWAGRAALGVAAAMLAVTVVRLFVRPECRTALDLALLVLCALAAMVPDRLIGLCMLRDMRCHTLTAPFVLVLAFLTALTALADLLLRRERGKGRGL